VTSRERLWAALNGQEVDRLPIYLLFPFHPNSSYADVQNIPCYRPVWEAVLAHTDFFDRRSFDSGHLYSSHPDIRSGQVKFEEGGWRVVEHFVEYRDIRLTQQTRRDADGRYETKAWFAEPADLEAALALPYEPVQPEAGPYFIEDQQLSEHGLMMFSSHNALSELHGRCRPETLALWSVQESEACRVFLDEMQRRCLAWHRALLETGVGPACWLNGSEFAAPPMVSPRTYAEWVTRYDGPLIALLQSYGIKVVVHHHGDMRDLVGGMKQQGFDGLHCIEAPPIGDCTLAQARAAFGSDVCLIGNIQYDDLARCTPEQIDRLVYEAIEGARGGPYILAPTAGPYEPAIPERMVRNYLQFIESGRKYGPRLTEPARTLT
jgi:hypothetical protein